MKKIGHLVMLGCAALLLSACQPQKEESNSMNIQETNQSVEAVTNWHLAGPDARDYQISFADVEQAVAEGAKFYDVRSAEEFAEKNFGITENFPITELDQGHLPDVPKDTTIYVHCLKGIRSAQATALLRKAGFQEVYDLGGLEQVEAIGGELK